MVLGEHKAHRRVSGRTALVAVPSRFLDCV